MKRSSLKPLLTKAGLLSQSSSSPSYDCLRRKFCNNSPLSYLSPSSSSSSSIFNCIEGIRRYSSSSSLHSWNNNGNKRNNRYNSRYNSSRSLQVSWFSSSSSQPSKESSNDVATAAVAGATAAEIEINRLTKTKELLKEQQTLLLEQIKLSAEKEMLVQEQISLLAPPAAGGGLTSSGSDESSRKLDIEKKLAEIEKKVPENIWALQKIKRKLDSNKAALEASDPKSTTAATPEDAVVTNQRENIELFKQFSPFKMAKLVLKSAIFPSQRAEVSKLLDLDLFSGTNSARLTYVMLQHPIIKKYGFDYENFMVGAREYIPIIIGNIDSKEFLDFCLNGKENESSKYLASICDPVVFYHLKEMVKDRHKTVRITNTEISDLALMGISPYQSLNRRRKEKPSKDKSVNNSGDVSNVADNVSSATDVASSDLTGNNSNSNSNNNNNSNSDSKNQNSNTTSDNNFVLDIRQLVTKSKQQDPFGTAWTNQFYPNLSSVIRVTVQFELRRYFKHVDNSNGELGSTDNKGSGSGNIFSKLSDDVKLQEEKTGDTMTAFLAFDACLSGERPYEWKLRHMNI